MICVSIYSSIYSFIHLLISSFLSIRCCQPALVYCAFFTCIHFCLNNSWQVAIYQYFQLGLTCLPDVSIRPCSFTSCFDLFLLVHQSFLLVYARLPAVSSRFYSFLLVYSHLSVVSTSHLIDIPVLPWSVVVRPFTESVIL